MIGYIAGKVQAVTSKYVIVDVNGVGYRVTIPEKSRSSIANIGENVKLYTHFTMSPRDGAVELYGFGSPEELNFFELLTSVSGIGPKSAQSILASADLQSLQIGIVRGDDEYLRKVSGMGPKTAKRLVLELKSKILTADLGAEVGGDLGSESEAIDALVSLGYSQYQARDVLKNIDKSGNTEDKIKEALKILGSSKK
jgi:Holliday junction DNA helicase RuvA